MSVTTIVLNVSAFQDSCCHGMSARESEKLALLLTQSLKQLEQDAKRAGFTFILDADGDGRVPYRLIEGSQELHSAARALDFMDAQRKTLRAAVLGVGAPVAERRASRTSRKSVTTAPPGRAQDSPHTPTPDLPGQRQ